MLILSEISTSELPNKNFQKRLCKLLWAIGSLHRTFFTLSLTIRSIFIRPPDTEVQYAGDKRHSSGADGNPERPAEQHDRLVDALVGEDFCFLRHVRLGAEHTHRHSQQQNCEKGNRNVNNGRETIITRSGSVLTGQIPPVGKIFQDIKFSKNSKKINAVWPWPLTLKSIGHILASWRVCMWSFMMIGVKEKQLCAAGNHFQLFLHCDLDLWPFDLKIYRAHPWLMGCLHVKFHNDRCKKKVVMCRKPFSVIYALWPWPLTFWPQNLWVTSLPHG